MFFLTVLVLAVVAFGVITAANVYGADIAWERQRERVERLALEPRPFVAEFADETDEAIEARLLEEDRRASRTRAKWERYAQIRARLEREGKVRPYDDGVIPMTALAAPYPPKSKAS